MKITINDRLIVEVDNYKNHSPAVFKEGGEIKTGKYVGGFTEDRFVKLDKHFRSFADCIRWSIENGYVDGNTLVESSDTTITIQEYYEKFKEIEDKLQSICKEYSKIAL